MDANQQTAYIIRCSEQQIEMLRNKNSIDPDIFNLQMLLLSIQPYSRWWRSGCVRSLRKAIATLSAQQEQIMQMTITPAGRARLEKGEVK